MKTLLLTLLLSQAPGTESEWSLDVRHDHAFGSCEGQLVITSDSVRYEAIDSEDTRHWSYPDVEFFEIVSATRIRIHTYEDRCGVDPHAGGDVTGRCDQGRRLAGRSEAAPQSCRRPNRGGAQHPEVGLPPRRLRACIIRCEETI